MAHSPAGGFERISEEGGTTAERQFASRATIVSQPPATLPAAAEQQPDRPASSLGHAQFHKKLAIFAFLLAYSI